MASEVSVLRKPPGGRSIRDSLRSSVASLLAVPEAKPQTCGTSGPASLTSPGMDRPPGPFRSTGRPTVFHTSQDLRSCSVPEDRRSSVDREIEDFAHPRPPHSSPAFCAPRPSASGARPSHASQRLAARPWEGSRPPQARADVDHRGFATPRNPPRAGLSESKALARYGRSAIFRYSGRGRPLVGSNEVSTAAERAAASEARSTAS
jgi:hypothetical protein